jgi:hypothetical protein
VVAVVVVVIGFGALVVGAVVLAERLTDEEEPDPRAEIADFDLDEDFQPRGEIRKVDTMSVGDCFDELTPEESVFVRTELPELDALNPDAIEGHGPALAYVVVECDAPHVHEVFAEGAFPTAEHGEATDESVFRWGESYCHERLTEFTGAPYPESAWFVTATVVDLESDRGPPGIVCTLRDPEFEQRTSSARNSELDETVP